MTPEEIARQVFADLRGPYVMEREEFEAMVIRKIAEALTQERERAEELAEALETLRHWAEIASHKLSDVDNWPAGMALKHAEKALATWREKKKP